MASVVERLEGAVGSLRVLFGDLDPSTAAGRLGDDELLRGLGRAADARAALDLMEAALAAEVQRRSDHGSGYDGLAQRRGHRDGTAMIQQVTGRARPDIERASRAGADLAAALVPPGPTVVPWFAPLTHALGAGTISRDQFDAIRRNLGEPPVDRYPDSAPRVLHGIWAEAASALIEEAQGSLVEDLRIAARVARDTLDPIGTQLRFDERFAARSFRMWIDDAGQHNARIRFETTWRPGSARSSRQRCVHGGVRGSWHLAPRRAQRRTTRPMVVRTSSCSTTLWSRSCAPERRPIRARPSVTGSPASGSWRRSRSSIDEGMRRLDPERRPASPTWRRRGRRFRARCSRPTSATRRPRRSRSTRAEDRSMSGERSGCSLRSNGRHGDPRRRMSGMRRRTVTVRSAPHRSLAGAFRPDRHRRRGAAVSQLPPAIAQPAMADHA